MNVISQQGDAQTFDLRLRAARVHRLALVLLLLSSLGGCLTSDPGRPLESEPPNEDPGKAAESIPSTSPEPERKPEPAPRPAPPPAPVSPEPAPSNLSWEDVRRSDGRFQVDVRIPVYLLGFDAGVATALNETLEAFMVDQSWHRNILPEVLGQASIGFPSEAVPMPLVPVAHFDVQVLPDADLSSYLAATGSGQDRDGNAGEAWAASRLRGLGEDLTQPALLLVHAGSTGHGYHYQYSDGSLSGLRIFGGTEPVIVFDASADRNAYADNSEQSYSAPLSAGGDATVQALADAVRDGTRHRLLQASLYPPSLAPCHAVTILYLVRTTSVYDAGGVLGAAEDAMDLAAIESAFTRLTNQTVHVDLKLLRLPVDDPVLDALYRGVAIGPGSLTGYEGAVAGVFLNQARGWVEGNFESYHVEHEGCAEYLGTLLYGDLGDATTWGIAMYDREGTHRVHFATTSESFRVLGIDWETHLVLHETGHLLSLAHPHDDRGDPDPVVYAWSPVVSLMSYQVQEHTKDPGSIDPVNHARNRAAFALQAADEANALDTAPAKRALRALVANDWDAATMWLVRAVEEQAKA